MLTGRLWIQSTGILEEFCMKNTRLLAILEANPEDDGKHMAAQSTHERDQGYSPVHQALIL
jgi:hypothetical protein